MASEMIKALEDLEKEKGIPKDYMLDRIGQALVAAYKALYKRDPQSAALDNVFVRIDEETGEISMHAVKTVVEEVVNPATEISQEDARAYSADPQIGDEVRINVQTKDFGRIATSTATQVIIQGIREAERGMIADEYASKEHEILTALVTRVNPMNGSAILELSGKRERTEAVLSAQEQIAGEEIREGDRVRVYVVEVRRGGKGPQIMLSRTHPGLVKRLFELEVPEIADGTVVVQSMAGRRAPEARSPSGPPMKTWIPSAPAWAPRAEEWPPWSTSSRVKRSTSSNTAKTPSSSWPRPFRPPT